MSETNEALLRRFLGYWATRDAAAMVECFAEDGVYDNVPERKPMEGREAIRTWLDMCFGHLTRIDVELLNVAVNGEWVLCERLDDHVIGERHMVLPVMGAIRIVDGKIVMFRDYYDRKTVAELGMG
ncbi:SgcJ/EcaC family oxidoreductase [Novosphingobium album (ex Hu et al. 2023)]|uniref:Nuclear transport factor 2 family protein n=1 Tax=Novosphingobium album (ex Hu et al. 2023) TaxID=2930093 RepID=A0ABT0AVW7_9SPHN|nr:nuclear transport factor 2 family protein [Novosphingobium album (ex Hu et al. 2023)]MCJ2176951.1 nuclear transport factor 2 family protein [Novosphingobium album (ex Hu et al. 2023)]